MAMQRQQIIPVRPTVFVGLGGTGKEILLRLRMKFFERYGQFGYPCISYLWIDTDMQNQNVDRKEMDPLLLKAMFKPKELVDIQVFDPNEFITNPRKYSWITQWMPPAVIQSGLRIQDGAGQVRSKGRFAFTWNFNRGTNVKERLERAISDVRNPQARAETAQFSDQNQLNLMLEGDNWGRLANFFVVCSLAGGTGSGTFLDTAFLIRQIASEQNFRPDITGLLFLSSLFSEDVYDRRFANSYAALKELEYYNFTPEPGARQVEDDQGGGAPRGNAVYALRKFEDKWAEGYPQNPVNGPPFNTCYLLDGYTFGGTPVTPDHKYEVFDMASEYLFWEFYRGDFSTHKRTIRPNNRQYLDLNHPEYHGDPQKPFHVQRFSTGYSSFGLSWIQVPLGSRIGASAHRLMQEILEYWERGGLMTKDEAHDALRKRNLVEEVRKAASGDDIRLSAQRIVEDLATTRDGMKFSEILKTGVGQSFTPPVQSAVNVAGAFEEQYLSRKVGAVIWDNVGPSKNRVLGDYKAKLLHWIMQTLLEQGFIPLLGFTFSNPDGTEGKVNGYLDVLTDIVMNEVQSDLAAIKNSLAEDGDEATERKAIFLSNLDDIDGNFVLFKGVTQKILLRQCMEAELGYAEADVGQWLCDVAAEIITELRDYVRDTKVRLKKFYDGILSPIVGDFADMRRRHSAEEKRSLSIFLYRNLDEYYRLGGNPVDVKFEKEQLFTTEMPDLWEVVTQWGDDKFRRTVEDYGWKKFQDDFRRRFAAGAAGEKLANAVQLFNEAYPPSDPVQRRNQISIFVEGGRPYVSPRLTLGPRTPQPHEDAVIGLAGITPSLEPGRSFYRELKELPNLGAAQGIETEKEAILYYHELTGIPLFYLSSLDLYRKSYDHFHYKLGQLPIHLHRRVDKFPEIFLYNPQEAHAMFNAWELVILGTIFRVIQVESADDNFKYFYYEGKSAETIVIGDERGAVRAIFNDSPRYDWCRQEIEKRKHQICLTLDGLRLYYGLLQKLRESTFRIDSATLPDGQVVSIPSFQYSVINRNIGEAEQRPEGKHLPDKDGEGPSPDWDALIQDALKSADTVEIERGAGVKEMRYYLNTLKPFSLK